MMISDCAAAPGHALLTMRTLNQNRDLLLRATPMRAARAIVSALPAILDEPVAPVAGAIGDNAHRGESWF
jgi:hypothetical protein